MALGIKETKEVLDLALSSLKAYQAAQADGKIDLMDLGQLMMLLPKVGPAVAGANLVGAELMDLDSVEGAELVAYVAAGYGLGSEKAKKVVVAAFGVAVKAAELASVLAAPEAPAA